MMANKTKNTVQLGIFVTVGVILFTLAVYMIGNKQNMFGSKFNVSAVFGNISGLQPGNNVRYTGINVGSVENIIILTDSTVRVDMSLNKEMKNFIRKNAQVSIGSDGLLGNMVVNISPGTPSMPLAEENDILPSFRRIETEAMLQTLGNTNENVALLSLNLLKMTELINQGHGTISLLLQDSSMAKNLSQSIGNLQQVTYTTVLMSQQLQKSISEVESGNGLLNFLLYDTIFTTKLKSITDQIDTMLIAESQGILQDLKKSAENIEASSEEMKLFMAGLNDGEGPLGFIISDTTATEDMRAILSNLNEGSVRLNENLEALKHNFLFRKYFKKQEKRARKNSTSTQPEELISTKE